MRVAYVLRSYEHLDKRNPFSSTSRNTFQSQVEMHII